jgi:hypothetical protein
VYFNANQPYNIGEEVINRQSRVDRAIIALTAKFNASINRENFEQLTLVPELHVLMS